MEETINNYDDVCNFHGITADTLPGVDNLPEDDREAVIGFYKAMKTAQAINGNHKFDWNNWNEKKHVPVFDMEETEENPSAFVFSYSVYDFTRTLTGVGSRLSYLTAEKAKHGAIIACDFYKAFMTYKK